MSRRGVIVASLAGLALVVILAICWFYPAISDSLRGPRWTRVQLPDDRLVFRVSFDPTSSFVLAATHDGRISVIDIATGSINRFEGHSDNVHSIEINAFSFSPSGKYLATSGNRSVVLWEWPTMKRVRTYKHPDAVFDVMFLNERMMLSATEGIGGEIFRLPVDSELQMERLATGLEQGLLPNDIPHLSNARFVVFGRELVVQVSWHLVYVDLDTGAVKKAVPADIVGLGIYSIPGANAIVAATETGIKILQTDTGSEIKEFSDEIRGGIASIAVKPDGTTIGVCEEASLKEGRSLVEEWDWRAGRRVGRRRLPCPIVTIAYSPCGTMMACGGTGGTVFIRKK